MWEWKGGIGNGSITVGQTRHNEDMNTIVMAVEILKRRLVMLEVVSKGHDA